jgi:2-C-methyl-D-erythritol 2,4-cyclodiphosphate synthase
VQHQDHHRGRPRFCAGPAPRERRARLTCSASASGTTRTLCHAITDAILGAAALGDIGRHFPDTDPQYKGANSLELLTRAVGIVREAGYAIENVDAVVIAERPKLAPHVDRVRARLAATLGIAVGAVSVKGKTNEGMDDTGEGAGIAVHAVALLRKD